MFEKRKKSLAVILKGEHLDLQVLYLSTNWKSFLFPAQPPPRIECGLDWHLILLFQLVFFSVWCLQRYSYYSSLYGAIVLD